MGSQQQEGNRLDYRKDQNEQKDTFPHCLCLLNVIDRVWDGALSQVLSSSQKQKRWKGTESP